MKPLNILLVTLLLQTPALSRTLHDCGGAPGQAPCDTDARKVAVEPTVEIDCSDSRGTLTETCRRKVISSAISAVVEERTKVQKQIDAMPATPPPNPAVIDANKKRCLARVMAMHKDPKTAVLGEVRRASGPAPDYDSDRGWFPSISYRVSVETKTSDAGASGIRLWWCSFDLSEQELLRVGSLE